MTLPHLPVTAPPANPHPHGLYAAATVTDAAVDRHQGGLTLDTPNIGAHGQWPTSDGTPKGGDRPDPVDFQATVVWATDEAKTVGVTEQQAQDRAAQTLRLAEQIDVEEFTADQLAGITNQTDAASVKHAVEQLEDHLTQHGYLGVIHARRGMIAHLGGVIVRQGGQLLTPGGHKWCFGAGYGALGDTLYGTGPVMVRRGPVTTGITTVDRKNNTRTTLAERAVAVGWEAPTLAATVPITR